MTNLPAPRSAGLIGIIGAIWTRALRFIEPIDFVAGADFAADSPVHQSYPTENSMSALAAFPWVRACVLAKADDLSGLPVKVMRNGEVVEGHPIRAILDQPATRTTWRWWIRQVVVDYELSGNHYSLVAGSSLLRMHPLRTAAVAQDDGQTQGYQYLGDRAYAWEDVLHVRNASWTDGIESIVGEGSIRALHADLTADLAAKRMTAKTAQRGRLEGVFTPADSDVAWGPKMIKGFVESIQKWATKGTGYLVLGGAAKFQSVTATPREMEFAEQRKDTRDAVLATFSVPPARLSLPTANFATQKQQMRTYWESLKGGTGSAVEDGLTWLARKMGHPGDTVVFDYSGVESLQEGMGERLARVGQHILNGIDAPFAYEMEGIEVPDGAFRIPVPAPVVEEPAEEPEDETKALLPSSEEERSATWRAFLDGVHKPAERDIHIATMRYLLQAADRYAKRIEEVGGRDTQTRATKALDDAQILAILSENEEMDHAIRALERPMKTALLRSFRASVLRMGTSLAFDPGLSILHEATRQTAVQITTMQSNVLRSLLSLLNQGATINEVQASLMTSHAFSATRSLRIARTEATRFVNAGADQAYGQALASGLAVRKQWLTARDGEVRTSHMALDGQTVDAGEEFVSSSGSTARFPGGFGIASLDINCRCTTIPVLEAS